MAGRIWPAGLEFDTCGLEDNTCLYLLFNSFSVLSEEYLGVMTLLVLVLLLGYRKPQCNKKLFMPGGTSGAEGLKYKSKHINKKETMGEENPSTHQFVINQFSGEVVPLLPKRKLI